MFCSPRLLAECLSSNWVVALEVSLVCLISWKQKLLLKQMNAKQAPNMVLVNSPAQCKASGESAKIKSGRVVWSRNAVSK